MSEKKLKLLVIEDSETDAELLIHILRQNDFDPDYQIIDTARDLKTYLSENDLDLIISDFNMPTFSGTEALKIAKEHDSLLPFILISGQINQQQETEILELGANEVIMKNNLNRLAFAVRRVLHEIADKRKLKKLIATKDKLFSVLAHDLRGTLEGIYVLSETMKKDVGREGQEASLRENLKMIAQSAKSTNVLLGNLLKWALMQLGSFKPAIDIIDLNDCLQKSIDMQKSNARRKKIDIKFEAPTVSVKGDYDMLSIVFRNLVSNAINYSHPENEIFVKVDDINNHVKIAVQDHGIGIPEEIKPKLFDPADRPKRSGTSNEESTGFGLLLCNDIVKMHGGVISVNSQQGEGSTFTVTLPKEKSKVAAASAL